MLRRTTLLPLIPVQTAAALGPQFLLDPGVPAWYTYPVGAVVYRGWREGGLPIWSSASGCGEPLAAASEPGILSPLRLWQALWPPSPLVFDAWALGRLWLTAWLCWGWAAAVGLGLAGRFTCAAAWTLSGFWVANVSLDSMDAEVWLPLLGAALVRGLARPGVREWLAGALAGAAVLLVGNPQSAIVDGAFLAALACSVTRRGAVGRGAAGPALLAAVWALVASAPVWLPLVEFLPRAQHVHGGAGTLANPPWTAVSLVWPGLWGRFGERLADPSPFHGLAWAGLVTVALAGAGVRAAWRRPAGTALVVTPLVLLAFVYGVPPFSWLSRAPVLQNIWWAKYQAPTFLALATLAGFGVEWLGARRGARTALLAACLVVAELAWWVPRARPAPHDPLVPATYVQYLRAHLDRREDRLWAPGHILEPHTSDALGLADARTYYGLYPRRAYWYLRGLVTGPARDSAEALFTGSPRLAPAVGSPGLRALAVRWLVTPPDVPRTALPPEWKEAFRGEMTVWERSTALPRARIVAQAVRVENARAALLATSGEPASRERAWVEGPADWIGFAVRAAAAPARILEDCGTTLDVGLAPAAAPRVLLVADTWEPGWKAFAGGHQLRVLPANCMFRAVAIPPGVGRVVFRFDPLPVKLGLLLAAWAGGLLLTVTGWSAGAPRARGAVGAAPRRRAARRPPNRPSRR